VLVRGATLARQPERMDDAADKGLAQAGGRRSDGPPFPDHVNRLIAGVRACHTRREGPSRSAWFRT
jgi:hypothetical protein